MHRRNKNVPYVYYKLGDPISSPIHIYRRRETELEDKTYFRHYVGYGNKWRKSNMIGARGLILTTREEVLKVFPALHI